jgi:hypothetical protein
LCGPANSSSVPHFNHSALRSCRSTFSSTFSVRANPLSTTSEGTGRHREVRVQVRTSHLTVRGRRFASSITITLNLLKLNVRTAPQGLPRLALATSKPSARIRSAISLQIPRSRTWLLFFFSLSFGSSGSVNEKRLCAFRSTVVGGKTFPPPAMFKNWKFEPTSVLPRSRRNQTCIYRLELEFRLV